MINKHDLVQFILDFLQDNEVYAGNDFVEPEVLKDLALELLQRAGEPEREYDNLT